MHLSFMKGVFVYTFELFLAMKKDGVKVRGYFAWSLMDNFEWARGYSEKFGLHQVNFSDPARPRVPKKSAIWYRDLIKVNGWEQPAATTPRSGGSSLSVLNCMMLAPYVFLVSCLW